MFITLFAIIKALLGAGLAGVLLIIGALSVVTWVFKLVISTISEAWHKGAKKGGEK